MCVGCTPPQILPFESKPHMLINLIDGGDGRRAGQSAAKMPAPSSSRYVEEDLPFAQYPSHAEVGENEKRDQYSKVAKKNTSQSLPKQIILQLLQLAFMSRRCSSYNEGFPSNSAWLPWLRQRILVAVDVGNVNKHQNCKTNEKSSKNGKIWILTYDRAIGSASHKVSYI